MLKPFLGYLVSRGWGRLTIFKFDPETHERIARTVIKPDPSLKREDKYKIVCEELRSRGIPEPKADFVR